MPELKNTQELKAIEYAKQSAPLVSTAKAGFGCSGGCNTTECTKEGRKDDSDKLRYDLIPPHALAQIVTVLTFGAKKYSDENWRKVDGLERRYISAAMRHIEAYRLGEGGDKETGVSPLAHAACCLMFILEARYELSETDCA